MTSSTRSHILATHRLITHRDASRALKISALCAAVFGASAFCSVASQAASSAAPMQTTPKNMASKSATASTKIVAPIVSKTPLNKTPLSEEQKTLQVLNRLAFGPRPGDVESVRRQGISRWIEMQLNPDTIDDAALDAQLKSFRTLDFSISQLNLAYFSDQLMTQMRGDERKQRQAAANGTSYAPRFENLNARQMQLLNDARAQSFEAGISMQVVGEMQGAKILRAIESKRQLQEVLVDFWANHFNLDVQKQQVRTLRLADERDVIRPRVLGKFRDLLGASAHSPAMLIYLDNARSSIEYSIGGKRPRNAVRPRKNRLNNATPISATPNSAMPNSVMPNSVMPNSVMPDVMPNDEVMASATMPNLAAPVVAAPVVIAPKKAGGINENYARELMELHTLGVGGGYTQKDVQEVARCFTGWSVDRDSGAFQFYPKRHDDGAKLVLGHKIPAGGGENDGERVLDILASQPSTAHFIALKLCRRLVSDAPPAALVARVAQVFLKSDGDLRAVTKAIVTSPEFFAPQNYRVKIKSPFEYAVSAARALDAHYVAPVADDAEDRMTSVGNGVASVRPAVLQNDKKRGAKLDAKTLSRQIGMMGEPLYGFQAPTGYSENSQDWVSSGALIARLNFALDLTNGRVPDLRISRDDLFRGEAQDDATARLARLENVTLNGEISDSTRQTLLSQMTKDAPFDAAKIGALLLGSPEFQRH